MNPQRNLIRKQYLVSEENVQKVEKLASSKGTSAAEIVRQAIEAFDPQNANEMAASDLMELVSDKLKEAITSTRKANTKVTKALKSIDSVKT